MSGTEDDDDLDRCLLFDTLFERGSAMYPQELQKETGIHFVRIGKLTQHEWFLKFDGQVAIATTVKHPAMR